MATATAKKPFFILDDYKCAFSLFCCIYGIGTLAIPTNFSRSGSTIAIIGLLFMGCANTYALFVLSKLLLLAPKSVQTYSDLGEWCMGPVGRYVAVTAQLLKCLLVPCAFLVLGGTLLDDLFPEAFSKSTWIAFMAVSIMPVCLIPTLKEGAGPAFAGCVGTLMADIIGVAMIMHAMRDHPSVPKPHVTFDQVATSFGNFALAYGGAILIPDLQRQHKEPTRMPRVILVTSALITVLFLLLGVLAYFTIGCQNAGNLLYAIYPSATTGLNSLGFEPDWGMVVLAFIGMQVHLVIAFAVICAPAFYIFERLLLGMHKRAPVDIENPEGGNSYLSVQTPEDAEHKAARMSALSVVNTDKESHEYEMELREYTGSNVYKYVSMRIVVLIVLVLVSVAWRERFGDLQTFIGASAHAASSILLPILFYLVKVWPQIPNYEKAPAILAFLIVLVFGCYSTYTSGKQLFHPTSAKVKFPYCEPEYQTTVYYIRNSTSL